MKNWAALLPDVIVGDETRNQICEETVSKCRCLYNRKCAVARLDQMSFLNTAHRKLHRKVKTLEIGFGTIPDPQLPRYQPTIGFTQQVTRIAETGRCDPTWPKGSDMQCQEGLLSLKSFCL